MLNDEFRMFSIQKPIISGELKHNICRRLEVNKNFVLVEKGIKFCYLTSNDFVRLDDIC